MCKITLGGVVGAAALMLYWRRSHQRLLWIAAHNHPLRFLSVGDLVYAARSVPERREEALAELTERLGYKPTL